MLACASNKENTMTLTNMYRAHRDRHIAYGWRPLTLRHWLDRWGRHVKTPGSFTPHR
jgi:hypothetical protein